MRSEITVAQFDLDGLDIRPDLNWDWHASFVSNIMNLKEERPKR
jgi:hypothetical protein